MNAHFLAQTGLEHNSYTKQKGSNFYRLFLQLAASSTEWSNIKKVCWANLAHIRFPNPTRDCPLLVRKRKAAVSENTGVSILQFYLCLQVTCGLYVYSLVTNDLQCMKRYRYFDGVLCCDCWYPSLSENAQRIRRLQVASASNK